MVLRQTAVLVLTIWSLLVSGQSPAVCTTGWFGSLWQYKCRCPDNNCTTEGVCGNDAPCQKGWFGPACQYADLAFGRSSDKKATDGDDNTCLINPKSTNVTVNLGSSYHVTWLRVRLSKPDLLYNLTVHFRGDGSLSCTNIRTARVDSTTLDIHCDLNETVGVVRLAGPGVQDLCSVYISGGRNVALRQKTSQSSTYREYSQDTGLVSRIYPSENAVDGDSDPLFYRSHTCSHTLLGDSKPNFNLTFSVPQHVTRYLLYNRMDNVPERLKGFELRGFGPSMTPVFNYTDRSSTPQPVYTVIPAQVTSPIRLVNIAVYQGQLILTLCELEVYGDPDCQSGQYGRECEHSCNCAGGQSCFVSTGGCPSGCADGFLGPDCKTECDPGSYGPGCQFSCSQFCERENDIGRHVCNVIDGTCLNGCQSGYQGSACNTRCDVGNHCPGCQTSCSQICARDNNRGQHFCDNINGTCLYGCQSGYQGLTCAERCDVGSYGLRCQSSCSQFCARDNDRGQDFCDNINGTCLHGCQSGYQGSTCAERCDVGSYGPRCQSSCSQFCARDKDRGQHFCDNINGTCLHGCQSGYQGSTCAERCDVGSHGPGCQTSCSQFCAKDTDRSQHFCDNINGTCLHGCQSGYQGPTCAERCDVGSYGPQCQSSCSQFCARGSDPRQHFCDNIDGTCLHGCQSGYQGSTCAERCDVGSHGLRCQSSCSQFCARDNDPSQHFCDNINGKCYHGCQRGYQGRTCAKRCDVGSYGSGCQSSCSQFCARGNDRRQHFCDNINGTCLHGCQSGYQGSTCAERCDVGSHGPWCQSSCSQFCARDNDRGLHFCDNINGTCLNGCQSGYQGSTCAERCDVGSYGPRCQSSCSQFCARGNDRRQHFCDNINGTCLHGCQSGYQGSTCAERCDVGSHGPWCQSSCSQFCARDKDRGQHFCDNINGKCLHGCQSGYQGSTCAEGCDVGSYGPRCQSSCSQFCARGNDRRQHFCDNINGTCLYGCQSGYQGSTCAERCDVGSHGPRCQSSCSQFCARDKDQSQHFCDNINGTCLPGCQSGYQGPTCAERCDVGSYGPRCQSSCSQFCARGNDRGQHFCDNINGTCLHGCQSGYHGPTCAERCDVGSYGPRCQSTCSQFCARGNYRGQHFCDNINGTCLYGCQSGYHGPTCAERCDVGSYGPRCQSSCSQFCARGNDRGQHFCDNINGTCLHGCQSGYQGFTCAERCDVGSYGPRCQSSCSQFCARGNDRGQHFCDNINGTCLYGCQNGYHGPTCAERCDVGSHGPGCQTSCSQFCARDTDRSQHFCDNIYGTCLHGCQSGYQGSTCAERCDVGSHGPRCQTSCSQFCARNNDRGQHFCDNVNGTCLYGCQSGYQGSTCAERCDVGSHGPLCQTSCSQFCARDNDRGQHFCDNINGTCLHGCQSGYQGSTCAENLSSNVVVVVVAVLGGVGVLVLVMVAVRFYRRQTVSKYGSTLDLIDKDDDDVEYDESYFNDVNSSTSEAAATSTQHQVKQSGSV